MAKKKAPKVPKPLTCPACKEPITTVNIVTRTSARVVDGKLFLPQPSQITANDIGDEGIECPECCELIRTPLEIVPANPDGEFKSWDEAAKNIPAGDIWLPRIETSELSEGKWSWRDTEADGNDWKGPFPSLELAAKDACEDHGFHPTIIQ